MVDDLRELEPSAWVFWQPVEDYDNMKPGGECRQGRQLGQIQLPFSCTADGHPGDVPDLHEHQVRHGPQLHALHQARRQADQGGRHLQRRRRDEGRQGRLARPRQLHHRGPHVTLDLSKFRTVKGNATVTPTVTSADGKLKQQAPVKVVDGKATLHRPRPVRDLLRRQGCLGRREERRPVQQGPLLHADRRAERQGGDRRRQRHEPGPSARPTARTAQAWQLDARHGEKGARQRYVFANPAEGKRLAVRDNVPVVEPDTGKRDPATEWIMSTTGDGTWTLVNVATGRLLEVGGQATNEGAAVTTWHGQLRLQPALEGHGRDRPEVTR